MLAGTGMSRLAARIRQRLSRCPFERQDAGPADPSYSLSASTANPVRTFADASTSGTASTIVAFNSCSLGGRTVAQRPRSTYSTKSRIAASLASCRLDHFRFAHHHHRTVVHRMPRSRRRKNNAVQQRHAQAKRRAAPQGPHQPARRRAVQKKFVAHAHVVRRHNEWQPIHHKPNGAHKGLIENAVNQFAIVGAAIRLALNFAFVSSRSKVAHARKPSPARVRRKCQSGRVNPVAVQSPP